MTIPGPLIVQSDHTVLLEVAHPDSKEAKQRLAIFAELERSPEHFHTYRITRLGLWNARAAGHDSAEVLNTLNSFAKFPIPANVASEIEDAMGRYGKLQILRIENGKNDSPDSGSVPNIKLVAENALILREVIKTKSLQELILEQIDETSVRVAPWARGELKQALLKRGWPVEDLAGFTPGKPLKVDLIQNDWNLRHYQEDAIERSHDGGSGVVVLPCGAGKTIVGAGVLAKTKAHTLILVTGAVSASQWKAELLARTSLTEDEIGEYSGTTKDVKPVTIATYQILSSKKRGEFAHLSLLNDHDWGLIIYDEVHLLPAPVFKLTAELQAKKRLGLTATLVREDGKASDVFSLIGPKRYDAPWKELEEQGFIAQASCFEVRVDMNPDEQFQYASAEDQDRYRIAASSETKIPVIAEIKNRFKDEQILIIGQYIDQLEKISAHFKAPLITGQTKNPDRERIFDEFRSGEHSILVVSKVANFSIDLPDASVAIQISGAYGSRQEEAQRLGRILRPKKDGRQAKFFSIVTSDSMDQDFALNRQRFLTEQGYSYSIVRSGELTEFLQGVETP